MKKGEKEIEGVTNVERPNRLGDKRRNNIIKTFALDKKKDDVRKYVVRREIKRKDKTFYKSPKIQRLITETRLRRKRQHKAEVVGRNKSTRESLEKYEKLLSQYAKEKKAQKEAAKAAAAHWSLHIKWTACKVMCWAGFSKLTQKFPNQTVWLGIGECICEFNLLLKHFTHAS